MNVTPIGAKSPSSTVVGISADATGNLKTIKVWDNELIEVYNMDALPESTATIWTDNIDVSNAGAVSLRFFSNSDAEYEIQLGNDMFNTKYALRDLQGEYHKIIIPSGSKLTKYIIVTPDELPILQWLTKLHIAIIPKSVPTTGRLRIWAVLKK